MRSAGPLLLGLLAGCSVAPLDAVTGASCFERPEQAVCARDVWPNDLSQANSDPWLSAHHDALREIRPRVLVLDFHNAASLETVRSVAQRQIDALAEGSRYRGYMNPNAPPFLRYELVDVVDLRDPAPPADWPYTSSSLVPTDAEGEFDLAALFGPEFTPRYGIDGEDGRPLALCELFETGAINELWLAVGDESPGREPLSMVECKMPYDLANQRVPGPLVPTMDPRACVAFPVCNATLRIAHLSPLRGPGCDLLVRGWAIRDSVGAIPYLAQNASRFFNQGLRERFGLPFDSLLDICEPNAGCVEYPTPSSISGTLEDGTPFGADPFDQGCGMPEFPPNARFMWDFENQSPVEARCSHYALGDAADGGDLVESYSFATVSARSDEFPDCGGAWQVYWRQSMPGLDNRARAQDGSPMKNWWPFLFY